MPRPIVFLLILLVLVFDQMTGASAQDSAVVPLIEIAEEDRGLWQRWSDFIIDFQRRANAEVALHMNAIQRGDDLGAFFFGLGIAFVYGIFHAFGPGHGKFIVMSYFIGRDANIGRGVLMSIQIAVVHVIAAVVIVWLADVILRGSTGRSLADVPGVRAVSFLIIAAIGLYMLYQAIRAALGYIDPSEALHGHSHSGAGHGHGHSHAHSHSHSHATSQLSPHDGTSHASRTESSLIAFAAGVVPCPGAVLIMLYAVANHMIYPGFLLVGAMSVGIGLTICALGVGAILARQTATRLMDGSDGAGGRVIMMRHFMNFGGAIIVTVIGVVSFIAFLDIPLAG
ncbi:MAG: hypothetical protein AAFX07_06565 [Pseudomonadota bacterium]